MSITDGQYILDMEIFRDGQRPAISTGLSVTRVGGVGHNSRQKSQAVRVMKTLAKYAQASEFARFGSELSAEAKADIEKGKLIKELLLQSPTQTFSLMAQQLMMEVVLNAQPGATFDMTKMKAKVNELAKTVTADDKFELAMQALIAESQLTAGISAQALSDTPETPQSTATPTDKPAEAPQESAPPTEPAKEEVKK